MPAEDDIGPIHHRVRSPALDFAHYLDLQQHLLKGLAARSRRRTWGWLVALAVIVLAIGLLPNLVDLPAELWLVSGAGATASVLGTAGVLAASASLLLVGLLLGSAWTSLAQMRMLRAIHAESSGLFGAHEVLFGERGVMWRNGQRATLLPWTGFTRLVRGDGQWLLIADHASAIWLPDASLADGPGEATILDMIARQTGLKPSDKDLGKRAA